MSDCSTKAFAVPCGSITHLCCARCSKYLGMGDWGLCCKETYDLVYEFSMPCPKFEQNPRCINASSRVGWFRCSKCGHFCPEDEMGDTCPNCGETVVGGIFSGQKHWRG